MELSRRSVRILLGAILLGSLGLRIGIFFLVYWEHPERFLTPDSPGYESPARALLHLGRFSVSPEAARIPETFRTPGYPSFVAAIYGIFGEHHPPVILVQHVLSVMTILLSYLLAARLWGPRPGLLAALMLSLDAAFFFHSQLLLTEALFSFLVALAVWAGLLLLLGPSPHPGRAGCLGFLLSAATMVRPVAYYLIWCVVAGSLASRRALGWRWSRSILAATLIAAPWVASVGGWQLRNYALTGSAEFSDIAAYTLLFYRGAGIVARRDGVSFSTAQSALRAQLPDTTGWTRPEKTRLYRREGLRLIRSYPGLFLQVTMAGLVRTLSGPGESDLLLFLGEDPRRGSPRADLWRLSPSQYLAKWLGSRPWSFAAALFALAHLLVLYGAAACGIWGSLRRERRTLPIHLFVLGVALYLLLVSAGPESYARFRVPVAPLVAAYAGQGLALMIAATRKWPEPALDRQ